MADSSKFSVAVHALCVLANAGESVTSDLIAGSVNTNPVVIRRVLSALAKAGFVTTAEGSGGGCRLGKAAGKILLADVFRAVEGKARQFGLPRADPNPLCPVGRQIRPVLRGHLDRFEQAMEREMGRVTIADVLKDIRSNNR